MPNTYFQFKKFLINQDRCAMKVCTDACIQGALAGREVQNKRPEKGLDIGTGTGLLSLMLSQNNHFTRLDAVEINEEACKQAKQNFKTAAFDHAIVPFRKDIRAFQSNDFYEFIICNPPFYENALKSPSVPKKQAMHCSDLNYEELLKNISRLLNKDGIFCLMYPWNLTHEWVKKAMSKGFWPYLVFDVKNKESKTPIRSVVFYSRKKSTTKASNLVIRTESNSYTEEFKELLRPYYLSL